MFGGDHQRARARPGGRTVAGRAQALKNWGSENVTSKPINGARAMAREVEPMDVLVLIDKLDDTIHNAKVVPLTDTVRVDKEEVYDILDQMRATIPEEIKQARWIVKERQEMLAEAKREAERVVKRGARGAGPADLRGGDRQAGRAPGGGDHRGRPCPRARDPSGRRGLRRRHPQHARGQPHEVHRRGSARPRPPPGPRRGRSLLAPSGTPGSGAADRLAGASAISIPRAPAARIRANPTRKSSGAIWEVSCGIPGENIRGCCFTRLLRGAAWWVRMALLCRR